MILEWQQCPFAGMYIKRTEKSFYKFLLRIPSIAFAIAIIRCNDLLKVAQERTAIHCKKNCCSFVDTTETVGGSVPIRQTFLSMQQHLSAHFSPAGVKESGD